MTAQGKVLLGRVLAEHFVSVHQVPEIVAANEVDLDAHRRHEHRVRVDYDGRLRECQHLEFVPGLEFVVAAILKLLDNHLSVNRRNDRSSQGRGQVQNRLVAGPLRRLEVLLTF